MSERPNADPGQPKVGEATEPPSAGSGAEPAVAVAARRRWRAVVALIAAMVLLVGALTALLASGDEPGDLSNERNTADGTPPAGSGTARQSPGADDLQTVVADISAFVETERGLTFAQPVEVALLGDGKFQQRLLEDFDEDVDEIEKTEVVYQAFGLMDGDGDLVSAVRRLLGSGVVGFYDPETDELVVRGARLSPYVRTTIAHELTHALDDQHLDLDRPEYDAADSEIGFGFTALVEGNARRVEYAYLESLDEDDQAEAAREELSVGSGVDLTDIPPVLVDAIGAPYQFGPELVASLLDAGGQARLDAAFAEPPWTSEQVLHPERFVGGEGAVDITPPEPNGSIVVDGLMGEMLVYQVLAEALGAEGAARAATGWGGDWLVAWRDGERSCARVHIVGDTPSETAELRTAFEQWVGSHEAATVDRVAGGAVGVSSCG